MSYCNQCQSVSCICGSPYYADGCESSEDHTQYTLVREDTPCVRITNVWNIPACGASSILNTPYLSGVSIGMNLWHKTYGIYEIVAFDFDKKQLTITNNCVANNATPGTEVPACTIFGLSIPSAEDKASPLPYLDADFVAPAVNACTDILLTNVNGLSTGNGLQIGTATYRISGIDTGTNIVTICNDGQGFIAGTVIRAQNVAGQDQYPVYAIEINPCAKSLNTSGIVQACVSGSQTGLTGPEANGSPLCLINNTTGEAGYSDTIPNEIATLIAEITALQAAIATLNTEVAGIGDVKGFASNNGSAPHPATGSSIILGSSLTTTTSNIATVSFTNPSSTRTLGISYTLLGRIYGNANQCNTTVGEVNFDLQFSINGGAYSGEGGNTTFFTKNDDNYPFDLQRVFTNTDVVSPGASYSISARVVVTWQGFATAQYIIDNVLASISLIATPL